MKFSIITSASNNQRTQMATIIQQDLKELGVSVQVVPLEFRSVVDRIFQSHDYEAVVLGFKWRRCGPELPDECLAVHGE